MVPLLFASLTSILLSGILNNLIFNQADLINFVGMVILDNVSMRKRMMNHHHERNRSLVATENFQCFGCKSSLDPGDGGSGFSLSSKNLAKVGKREGEMGKRGF